MPYCENCESFKEEIVNGKFGDWWGYCQKIKISRSIDSDICDKYQENEKIEKIVVHRAEIKLERLDECFE